MLVFHVLSNINGPHILLLPANHLVLLLTSTTIIEGTMPSLDFLKLGFLLGSSDNKDCVCLLMAKFFTNETQMALRTSITLYILFFPRAPSVPFVMIIQLRPFLFRELLVFEVVLVIGWYYALALLVPTHEGLCFVIRLGDNPIIAYAWANPIVMVLMILITGYCGIQEICMSGDVDFWTSYFGKLVLMSGADARRECFTGLNILAPKPNS